MTITVKICLSVTLRPFSSTTRGLRLLKYLDIKELLDYIK